MSGRESDEEQQLRHALKNYLHSIGLCIEVLNRSEGEDTMEFLAAIESEADACIQLLDSRILNQPDRAAGGPA